MLYENISSPISCQIEISNSCDNRCIYCYNSWQIENDNKSSLMSKETSDIVFSEIIKNKIFFVTFTGGEPLFNKSVLFDGIEKLIKKDIICNLNSNLNLLTLEDAKYLKKIGLKSILTSISSYKPEKHNSITKNINAFEKLMNGIENAKSAGLEITCNMVVNSQNIDDVIKTGQKMKELGISSFFVTPAQPPLNVEKYKSLLLTKNDILTIFEKIYFLKNESLRTGALSCYPLCLYLDSVKYDFLTERRCCAGITDCTIGVAGDIRPCSQNDEIYGYIQNGLKKAWNNMISYRMENQIPEECMTCDFFNICGGGCRVNAKYHFGSSKAKDPWMNVNDIGNIKLPQKKEIEIKKDIKYVFSEKYKHRNEKSGVFYSSVYNKTQPIFLTYDTFDLIKHFENKSFSFDEIKIFTKMSEKKCLLLFILLFNDKIITIE